MRAILHRQPSGEKQTLGELSLYDDRGKVFSCKTLELPWKNNAREVSCIPPGTYMAVLRYSPKNKRHFHVLNVPGREWILIHSGNYYSEIRGCILIGEAHTDINGDGLRDVTGSRKTLDALIEKAGQDFELTIL